MTNPAYYIDGVTGLIDLPAPRYSELIGTERKAIMEETEEGTRFVYRESKRHTRRITFRCLEADIEIFRALHEAVMGDALPFYYLPSGDDTSVEYLVRKEKSFAPKELDEPAIVDGETVSVWDYELTLLEEVAAAEILA